MRIAMLIKLSKLKIAVVSLALIGLAGLIYPPAANAQSLAQLLQKQAELQRQAKDNQLKIAQKQSQVNDLQGTIASLDDSIAATQAKITNTQDQITVAEAVLAELTVDIQQAQSQLDDLQLKLRNAYVSLYELSQASSFDSLLTSASLSDMVTQTQYIQSLQTELQSTIDKATLAKADLETKKSQSEAQKADLVTLKAGLTSTSNTLNSQRNQKNSLLTQTQGQQAQYESLLKDIQNEAAKISDQIYQFRQQNGGYGNSNDTSGYPYANVTPDIADQWSFLTRECTSYAAYRWDGSWYRNPLPAGVPSGDAKYWPAMARDRGFATGSTPVAGALVVWGEPGKYLNTNYIPASHGHVAYVEHVDNSSSITISQYNWAPYAYSEKTVDPHLYGDPTYIYR